MRWRLILTLFIGTASILFGSSILLLSDPLASSAVRTSQLGLIGLCGASALLAYPLWTGRYWALLVLRFLVFLTAVPIFALSIADFGHAQGGLSTTLGNLAFYGSLFTVPMFVLAVLFHPSVVDEFRHQNVSGS